LRDYIALARPSHWVKNVFILPGALAAVMLGLWPASWLNLVIAIAATCLIASANYVVNEWLDAASDAHHPLKNKRPAVLGKVTARGVVVEYALLAAMGLALGVAVSSMMALTLAFLLVMGLAYNVRPVRLKDRPYSDVLSESVNNAIRLLIGWFAVSSLYLPPVSLVLGYWMGGAFLMAVKRLAEYRMIGDPERAARYRLSFGHYTSDSLVVSILVYAMSSSFFLGVFLVKYRFEFLLAMPAIWLLFAWYLRLGFQKDSVAQKPEALYRQTGLLSVVALVVALLTVLSFAKLPAVDRLGDTRLIGIAALHLRR
jgi:decaprenyl-phosphate phosphoribosyltransferase